MIKELVNFTKNLDEDFKNLEVKCREGIHIMLQIEEYEQILKLNPIPKNFEVYSKKINEESDFITGCKFLSQNAWCIDTNKCFDLPTKAIHSCSPFLVAFKREHLEGGEKFKENASKNKKQITERFENYFDKAFELLDKEEDKQKYTLFKNYFISKSFEETLRYIENVNAEHRISLSSKIEELQNALNSEVIKLEKELLKQRIKDCEYQLLKVRNIEDSEYFLFYLDEPLEQYKIPHGKYLADKLFNTDKYNTSPEGGDLIYGTSNFMNSFNSNMPFLIHQNATFSITSRISNIEAKHLNEFIQILGRKILPNPLPIFVFKEELQGEVIEYFKQNEFRVGFREIVERFKDYKEDFGNYYLLNWANSADGIIFRDFDFVSKFDYEFKADVEDLFGAGFRTELSTIFEFQNQLLPIIFNNNFIVKTKDGGVIQKYFDEIDAKFCKSSLNQILILKYRMAFYDFIYKSKRQSITQHMFNDIMSNSILEDIRLDKMENGNHKERFNILKKLNIWFSLYERFNQNTTINEETMASKLKDYQIFVSNLALDKADTENATDKEFAFAAGQIIEYLLKKSAAENKTYQLLEPYLQKVKCSELKRAISTDIARYKHAINMSESRFKLVCDFVLTYETEINIKELLPELLAGIFSKNQFFKSTTNN